MCDALPLQFVEGGVHVVGVERSHEGLRVSLKRCKRAVSGESIVYESLVTNERESSERACSKTVVAAVYVKGRRCKRGVVPIRLLLECGCENLAEGPSVKQRSLEREVCLRHVIERKAVEAV